MHIKLEEVTANSAIAEQDVSPKIFISLVLKMYLSSFLSEYF